MAQLITTCTTDTRTSSKAKGETQEVEILNSNATFKIMAKNSHYH